MANQNDSFIDEVTAELRRDRLFVGLKRYGWIVVLGVVGIVGGSAWYEYTRAQDAARAEAWGDAILAAEGSDDAAAALAAVDPAGSTGRQALSALLAGSAAAEAGDPAKAAADLRAAAEAAGAGDPVLRDLALLKAVIAAGPTMGAAERDALLTDLSKPGAPFELLALEQKVVALIAANRREDAVTLIRQIQKKDGLSEPLRRRLAEMMTTLDADPEPVAGLDAQLPADTAAAPLADPAAAPVAESSETPSEPAPQTAPAAN
ncbi:tetratricopeptide repeat protein [Paracoccus cavernae]|uniref:Tetratricopeptide repeat protein n=1 Tax=Paracoccus cavernae TaxID=1571207 RepID=A0ABT8D4A4_9RHOB|nr:tetratricopeptide repeat protein [Paracoccus cavernae]